MDVDSGDGMGDGTYSWDNARGITLDPDGILIAAGHSVTARIEYDVVVRGLAP